MARNSAQGSTGQHGAGPRARRHAVALPRTRPRRRACRVAQVPGTQPIAPPGPTRYRCAMTILCIGSVLWDIIGRTPAPMQAGMDVPGRITRLPGGVALNIAMTLARMGARVDLLSAVGHDASGADLIAACQGMGLGVAHLYRTDLPTDIYMAIEGANGLIAAIADAHSLEAAGEAILAPLGDGRLGSRATPFAGIIALDGNLTEDLLAWIAASPLFACADLRIAPASPGKAGRLAPLMAQPNATLYVNLSEAGTLSGTLCETSAQAARAMIASGARRVLVTDGARDASFADRDQLVTCPTPRVPQRRITGAGDTFMAAHIMAERAGADPAAALKAAQRAASAYVSGEDPC
jgi:pseudouridine kinase